MTSNCTNCGKPASALTRPSKYVRGGRSITVTTTYFECTHACKNPFDGSRPLQWVDMNAMKENENLARVAWYDTYGEIMPKAKYG